jgi:hypothetical protein
MRRPGLLPLLAVPSGVGAFAFAASAFAHGQGGGRTPALSLSPTPLGQNQCSNSVVVTFMPEAFTSPSSPKNSADYLWRRIAAALVPAEAPPIPPDQQ